MQARNKPPAYFLGSVIWTVWASGALIDSGVSPNCVRMNAGWSLRMMARWKEYTTSSAVIGLPEWNFTPFRRVKVHTMPSGETFHDSASDGSGLSYLPGAKSSNRSYTWAMTPEPYTSNPLAGSREVIIPSSMPTTRTSERVCARAGDVPERSATATTAQRTNSTRLITVLLCLLGCEPECTPTRRRLCGHGRHADAHMVARQVLPFPR